MEVRIETPFQDANQMVMISAELQEATEQMLDDEEARIREGKENVPVPRNRVKELTLEENNKIHDALQQPDPEYVCCPECGGTKKNPEDKRKRCDTCNGTGKTYVESRVEESKYSKDDSGDGQNARNSSEMNGTDVPIQGTDAVSHALAEANFVPHVTSKGDHIFKNEIKIDGKWVDTVYCNPAHLGHKWKSPYYTSKELEHNKNGTIYQMPKEVDDAIGAAKQAVESDIPVIP